MHLHLDCQFGMAGDMLLAALVDSGADQEVVVGILLDIPLEGFELDCRRTTRNGVAAMLADVRDKTGVRRGGKHTHDHSHDDRHDHGHGHHHHHDHGHEHDHEHPHDHGHGCGCGGPHRHLGDLLSLLEGEGIAPRVKERAARVFRILAEAEAAVHGQPVERVHFHEISGIDTAVDVIGSCIALELLGVDSISASPPSVGSGMVMCDHGIFPVPAPATLEILKSHAIPWRPGGEGERTTPTGAALLAGLVDSYGDAPEMTVARIGYGAGHKEFPDVPNLLRAIIGRPGRPEAPERGGSKTIIAERDPVLTGDIIPVPADESLLPAEIASMLPGEMAPGNDRVVEFRLVVDDMTPEAVAFLCERCLAAGAVEAYAVAAIMKKGRPGHELTVLSLPDIAPVVADVLWRESTTFGMRVGERSRLVLSRDVRKIVVLGQKIRVKIGWRGGAIVRRQPEFDDCRAAAAATGRPLRDIFRLAEQAADREGWDDLPT